MPTYQYKAKDQSGQEIVADIQAVDTQEALAKVMEKGLFPLSLREKTVRSPVTKSQSNEVRKPEKKPAKVSDPPSSFWLYDIWPGSSLKRIVYFTRQLAVLQEAGLPILRSMQLLHKQLPPGRFRAVVRRIVQNIEAGRTLTEALEEHPKDFDPVYIKMVQAGETGGFLEQTLLRIADAKEKTLQLRRKVIRAMMYPGLVCIVAILIVMGIFRFIIPMIVEGGGNISGPLGDLIRLDQWFTKGTSGMPPGWLIILGIAFGWHLLRKRLRLPSILKSILDQTRMKIPVLGKFFYKLGVVRFSRVLGSLVGAGVPIIQALESSRDVTGNEAFARAIDQIHEEVSEGSSLTKAIVNTHVFDPAVMNIIEVGEETGDLDKVLLKLADNYQEELDYHISYMMTVLEVLLIVMMCVFVGGLIVILYSSLIGGAGGM